MRYIIRLRKYFIVDSLASTNAEDVRFTLISVNMMSVGPCKSVLYTTEFIRSRLLGQKNIKQTAVVRSSASSACLLKCSASLTSYI